MLLRQRLVPGSSSRVTTIFWFLILGAASVSSVRRNFLRWDSPLARRHAGRSCRVTGQFQPTVGASPVRGDCRRPIAWRCIGFREPDLSRHLRAGNPVAGRCPCTTTDDACRPIPGLPGAIARPRRMACSMPRRIARARARTRHRSRVAPGRLAAVRRWIGPPAAAQWRRNSNVNRILNRFVAKTIILIYNPCGVQDLAPGHA